MLYLVISITASVLVSLLFKIARHKNLQIVQAIGVNYLTATLLTALIFQPKFSSASDYFVHWPIFIFLGFMMPIGFFVMAKAINHAGIVKADAASRLSLFLSLIAAFLLFGDKLTAEKIAGIALAFLSMFLLIGQSSKTEKKDILWIIGVWICYGVADITFKEIAHTGLNFTSYLIIAFALSAIVTWSYLFAKRSVFHLPSLALGLLLGALNFTNIYTYVRAHIALSQQTATVFTTMNIGVIVLSTVIGGLCFKEPISKRNWLGILIAIFAILVLFQGSRLFL